MTDYRSLKEAQINCSLSRAVDLDMSLLSAKDKHMLEREARLAGWIEGEYKSVALEKSKGKPMTFEASQRIRIINDRAGEAFDQDDEWTRNVCSFATHYNMAQFDIWTNSSKLWRPWTGINVNAPFLVAEEQQYGTFIYDTWLDVYELERYFYNWCLRMYYWLNAGLEPEVRRWVLDESHQLMPEDTWLQVGRAPFPKKLYEKLQDPTRWLRKEIPGGSETWQWPLSWMTLGGVGLSEIDVCRYMFSWHELLMRFEELGTVRRAALAFEEDAVTRAERSCGAKLAHRVAKWGDRFGPWYTFVRNRFDYEGSSERAFLHV